MFYITRRDEDGTWYLAEGALNGWNYARFIPSTMFFQTRYFYSRAYAEKIAAIINSMPTPIGYMVGKAQVREL